MSSYRGIFAQKLSTGVIIDVYVEDSTGTGNTLPIAVYRQRGIQPPAESLPDQHQFGSRSPQSKISMPFGIKIATGDQRHLTHLDGHAMIALTDGEWTEVFAPDEKIRTLWCEELAMAGCKFQKLQ